MRIRTLCKSFPPVTHYVTDIAPWGVCLDVGMAVASSDPQERKIETRWESIMDQSGCTMLATESISYAGSF